MSNHSLNNMLKREECVYTSCYCEENVYQICKNVANGNAQSSKESYAVFISSPKRVVPIWKQKACKDPGSYVAWDYHVIFIQKDSQTEQFYVYDLDTVLPFPTTFKDYFEASFLPVQTCPPHINIHQWFRIVSAKHFVKSFASDRHHMLNSDGLSYQMPPPEYPCISTANSTHNLDKFWQCDKSDITPSDTFNGIFTSSVWEKYRVGAKLMDNIDAKANEKYGVCVNKFEFFHFFGV